MQIERGNFCPLIQKNCMGAECVWFTQLRGQDPNTGKDIDEWGCAIAWLPVLLIENARETKSTTASVESFRNEMAKNSETNLRVLESAARLHHVISTDSINNTYLPS